VALEEDKITTIFENNRLTVESVPLFHRIPTWGFVFREKIIPNTAITIPPKSLASYAYFSDTRFDESLAPFISGIDVLYHEATFSDAEAHLAGDRFHATSRQAATLAQKANVKRLLLGHISSRFLNNTSALEQQAQEVFPNATVVSDGDEYEIP
jgi:ribonuclease Z